jgi:uncharacterized protein
MAIISLVLLAAIIAGFYLFFSSVNQVTYKTAQIGIETFKLELADTDAKRVKGLSERDSLPAGQGMLFDFKQDGNWQIWMVQMRFPLDIVWLDASKRIIHIKQNAKPADFPEKYKAPQPSRYVIEVNSGEFERLGLTLGDYVSF